MKYFKKKNNITNYKIKIKKNVIWNFYYKKQEIPVKNQISCKKDNRYGPRI